VQDFQTFKLLGLALGLRRSAGSGAVLGDERFKLATFG
jgi:hypothetical protein